MIIFIIFFEKIRFMQKEEEYLKYKNMYLLFYLQQEINDQYNLIYNVIQNKRLNYYVLERNKFVKCLEIFYKNL